MSSASFLTPSGLGIETDPGSYTLFLGLVCEPGWLPPPLFHEPVDSLSPHAPGYHVVSDVKLEGRTPHDTRLEK